MPPSAMLGRDPPMLTFSPPREEHLRDYCLFTKGSSFPMVASLLIRSYFRFLPFPSCTFKNLNFCFPSEPQMSGTPSLESNKHSN